MAPIPSVSFRALRADEADEACALARAVFEEYVGPEQSEEGRRMFQRFAQPGALLRRHRTRYASWVAVDGPRVVGLLHVHAGNHISLLFTAHEYQGRGVATGLVRAAVESGGFVTPATVNSSPAAVTFYARLGFVATGPALLKNGVRHQPMTLAALPEEWRSERAR